MITTVPTVRRSRIARPGRRRVGVAALAGSAALVGCSILGGVTLTDTVTIDLGSVTLGVAAPADHELADIAIGGPGCVDTAAFLEVGPGRDHVAFSTASPGLSCPEEQPLNGRFPSWASVEELPDGVTPVESEDGLPEGSTVARFAVDYTECTNSCTTTTRPVAFVELPDGRTFFAVGFQVDTDVFDAMIASLRVTG